MSDKIKRAARERQRETGESYATARRMVIAEHERAQGDAMTPMSSHQDAATELARLGEEIGGRDWAGGD